MDIKRNILILNNKIITDKTNSHRVYPTLRQKRLLVDILEKNPQMLRYQVDYCSKDSNNLWDTAAKRLNSMAGAKKTTKGWRKCWHDMKRNARIKFERLSPFQETKLDQIHMKILKLQSNKFENNDEMLSTHEVVLANIKTEEVCTSEMPQTGFYFRDVAVDDTEQLEPSEKLFCLQFDKSVNTDKDHISLEEKKLQLKKDYYDAKLKILEKQTLIQERMLNVFKGIATSLIDKI